jgi:hypothetical protein
MIYEFTKVELYGISWLNYFTLGLILTIISLIAVFVFAYFAVKKNGDEDSVLSYCVSIFVLVTLLCGIFTLFNVGDNGKYSMKTIPLSTLDDKITVNGDKVTINKFDKPYGYEDLTRREHEYTPKNDTDQIFKFEYDEFYESGKLLTENGGYYKLSREDARYLKGKGAK